MIAVQREKERERERMSENRESFLRRCTYMRKKTRNDKNIRVRIERMSISIFQPLIQID